MDNKRYRETNGHGLGRNTHGLDMDIDTGHGHTVDMDMKKTCVVMLVAPSPPIHLLKRSDNR